jgi:hypothetical protein
MRASIRDIVAAIAFGNIVCRVQGPVSPLARLHRLRNHDERVATVSSFENHHPPVRVILPRHLELARCRIDKMGLLAGKAGHGLITFGVFRYILCHKALDPVAGIRAAVEKRRHRSTEVRISQSCRRYRARVLTLADSRKNG